MSQLNSLADGPSGRHWCAVLAPVGRWQRPSFDLDRITSSGATSHGLPSQRSLLLWPVAHGQERSLAGMGRTDLCRCSRGIRSCPRSREGVEGANACAKLWYARAERIGSDRCGRAAAARAGTRQQAPDALSLATLTRGTNSLPSLACSSTQRPRFWFHGKIASAIENPPAPRSPPSWARAAPRVSPNRVSQCKGWPRAAKRSTDQQKANVGGWGRDVP